MRYTDCPVRINMHTSGQAACIFECRLAKPQPSVLVNSV
jgi:hypothetical protein